MTNAIEAVYEQGLLRPLQPLTLNEGEKTALILVEPMELKLAAMRAAMSDPVFLADLREVAEDFQRVDVARFQFSITSKL